ncbi:uncharacterized protein LOC106172040 [Lingula anatina]|uniref:Uncharacterized protein LOC106172040 n=1 Tax=Lingula anatina TaxID=7574 RepID=A0A1S3JD23_LINAN|nr:uncharacterized protein LOC106172040 [Lingula anatina]|eukprot:XP_013408071.1 uncharacterized protein LOC106172040 [Lingula anatina]
MKYYAKLSRLLIDHGAKALRNYFKTHILDPAGKTLGELFAANRTLLDDLYRGLHGHRKLLYESQYKKIFPPSNQDPELKEFDITLLFLLTRQLHPQGPSIPPPKNNVWNDPNDQWHSQHNVPTKTQAIILIKYERNKLAHRTTTDMEETDFECLWNRLSSAIVEVGGMSQEEVTELHDKAIEPEREAIYCMSFLKEYLEEIDMMDMMEREFADLKESITKVVEILDNRISDLKSTLSLEQKEFMEKVMQSLNQYFENVPSSCETQPSDASSVAKSSENTGVDCQCKWAEVLSSYYIQHCCSLKWPTILKLDIHEIFTEIDMSDKHRDHMTHCQIFDQVIELQAPPRRILIEGQSGSGKTVLASKIALDWAYHMRAQKYIYYHSDDSRETRNYVKKFQYVFLLQNVDVEKSIEEHIFELNHLFSKPIEKREIQSIMCMIERFQEDVLFIVDVDENLLHKHSGGEILELIRGERYCRSTVVVTSRPLQYRQLRDFRDFHVCYNNGFDPVKGKSVQFVKNYAQSTKVTEDVFDDLIEKIQKNTVVADLAKCPLFCLLLCMSYHSAHQKVTGEMGRKERRLLQVVPQVQGLANLFSNLVDDMMVRVLDQRDQIAPTLKILCKYSWDALMKGTEYLAEDEDSMLDLVLRKGLLQKCDIGTVREQVLCIMFPHQSIKLFLAAKYMTDIAYEECFSDFPDLLTKRMSVELEQEKLVSISFGQLDIFLIALSGLLAMERDFIRLEQFFSCVQKSIIDTLPLGSDKKHPSGISSWSLKDPSIVLILQCLYEACVSTVSDTGEEPERMSEIMKVMTKHMSKVISDSSGPQTSRTPQSCFWVLARLLKYKPKKLIQIDIAPSMIESVQVKSDLAEGIGKCKDLFVLLRWETVEDLQLFLSHICKEKSAITYLSCCYEGHNHIETSFNVESFKKMNLPSQFSFLYCHNTQLSDTILLECSSLKDSWIVMQECSISKEALLQLIRSQLTSSLSSAFLFSSCTLKGETGEKQTFNGEVYPEETRFSLKSA